MPRGRGRGRGGHKSQAAVGYQHSAALSEGVILTDIFKKEWKIHKPIGQGGFGVIYLASKNDSSSNDAEYVIKIEPKGNGPLFCECNFYQRVAKSDHIQKWINSTKKKTLGMPKFITQGSHSVDGVENRFLVMEKFGKDLQKLFVENGKRFPRKTVAQLALRVIDVLEYIHSKDFVHADIKAANLLLGSQNSNQVFLVDFGLATRYRLPNGTHVEYKEDPKKAHDGTIEFTSRDAHRGVASSRRSDLEILGYCLLQWLCGQLPWEDNLANKNHVRDQKFKYMDDIPALMKKCFKGADYPSEIQSFLEYVVQMNYTETPDYKKVCQIFQSALKSMGAKDDKLVFTGAAAGAMKITSPKRKIANGKSAGASPVKRARRSSPQARSIDAQYPTPAKTKRASSARAMAAESQCPTPVKRTPAKATPRKRSAPKVASPLSPELGSDVSMPYQSLKGKRKSNTPPNPSSTTKLRKRAAATKARARMNESSDDESGPASPVKPLYEFMMRTKTTIRQVRRAQSVQTKATQTSPGLKGLNPRKRKT